MADITLNKDIAILSISAVRELTGLTDRQIRYYESKSLLTTVRNSGGQRKFSLNDIEKLIDVRNMLSSGDSIKDIQEFMNHNKDDTDSKDSQKKYLKSLEKEFIKIGRLDIK
jgi:MerR family glutamine synthetase transcriptional repressor